MTPAFNSALRKAALALSAPVVLIIAIVLWRTFALPAPISGRPAPKIDVTSAEARAAAEHLGAAIRIETISNGLDAPADPAKLAELHAFLAATYPAAHAAMMREVLGGSLMYRWPGADPAAKPIAFLAHLDVVPVEGATDKGWTHPPFSGLVADGRIWGRGALDDKGTVIALMEAAERLAREGFKPQRDVYFLFGQDEEIGGAHGAGAIASLLKSRGVHLAWTLDEGSAVIDGAIPGAKRPVALIATGEKGYLTLRLSAHMAGGHSSAPGKDTAVSLVSRAVVKISNHPYPVELDKSAVSLFETLAPELPFGQRLALANLWLTGSLVKDKLAADPAVAATLRTTTAPTMLVGGVKDNVLPETASAIVNYRVHPRDTGAAVIERTERLIGDKRVRVETVQLIEPSRRSSTQSDGYRALAAATEDLFGATPTAPSLVIGGTDSQHYEQISENCYRFSPILMTTADIAHFHGTDESLSVENLVRAAGWYENVIKREAGSPPAAP